MPNALGTRNVTSVDGALVLAWTHGTTAARPVVEYEARWKRAANDWSGSSASDEQRSWTRFGGPQTRSRRIGGLTNGTAYDVAVRGVNGAGTGDAWEFERTPSVPGAPTRTCRALPRTSGSSAGEERLVLSWLPPSGPGSQCVVRVQNTVRPAGTNFGHESQSLGADARQVTITGLTRGTRYEVVAAGDKQRRHGEPRAVFQQATVFGRPYAVRDLAADPDDGQVVLTWREPRGSGSPVTGYRWRTKFATVAWGEDGTSEWFDLPVTARTVTSVTFSALNGTTFDYQVRAVNAIGEGDLAEVSATPLNERPDAPPDFAAREGHRAVGLTWNAPPDAGPAVTGYEVEVRRAGASAFAALATVTGTAYLDAAPGGTGVAHYRVRAVNAAGDGAWAVLEDVALGPAAVGIEAAGARVEEGVSAAFTLTATRPPLAGGPALEVAVAVSETGGDRVAAGDEGTRTVAVPAGAAREAFAVASADDTAVEPDSVVRARVAASTDYATGSPAEAEVTVTEDDAVPGSVGVVLFEGHRAARVAWAPPEHAGASEITGYDVGYRLVGTTAWRTVAAGAAATELTLAHLDDGRWQFRVRAVNAEGAGPWSPGHGAAVVGPATVTVTAGDDVAAGAPARFTLSADRAPMDPSRPLAVEVALAESGGDLVAAAEEGSRTVAFALGETSAPLAVATGGEGTAGGASTLTATLADGAGAYLSGTPASAELAVTPGAARLPDAPTGVAAEPGHRAALIRWEAPARESAAPVTGYEVSWSRNGVEAGLASTAATAYLIETVHAHGEHAVRVRAVSAAGAGAWSEPLAVDVVSATVTVEADADAVVEGTPAAFTLAADRPALSSERTLEVTVSVSETGERVAPDDEGTRTVAFAVGARSAALAVATERDADAEDDSTLTVTLPAASGYSVGDPASAAVAVTGAGAPGVPRALAVAPGHRALGLSWEAPLAGGAPVTGYTVRFRASEDAPWATLSLGKDDTSVVLELADGDWALEVAAVGAGGAGRWVATKATVARAEVRIGALEQGVAEGSAARFALSADRPVLVATRGLSVPVTVSETGAMVAPGDEGTRTVAFAVGASEAAFEVATADDGAAAADSTVTAALAASAGYRAGTPAEAEVVVYASGKPPAPPDLVATEGHSTAKLAWGEPDGGAVVRYEVQVSSADLPAWSTLAGADAAAGLTARSFVAGVGLTHGEGYRFRVRAVNAVGAGPWSEVEGVAVVPATVRVVPGVNVAEGASAVFTLLADRPVLDAAGRPLEVGITVTETGADMVAEADEGTRTVVFAAGARAAAVRIASAEDFGAGPDSVVRVEVAAPASVGDYRVGAPAAGAVTVLDGGDAPPLGAPANLAATEGHLAVALAWEAPPAGGGALSHYEVQYLEGGTWRALDALPAGTALTAGALPEGTYRFRVRAANAGGAGPWSATLAGVEIARATVGIDAAAGAAGGVAEGAAAEFTLSADRAPLADGPALEVAVEVSETGGDMVVAGDEGTRTVAFAAGETTAALAVATADDGAGEADSAVTAAIATDDGYRVGTPASATVTVANDDLSAPRNLRATAGHRGVLLEWDPPAHDGGSTVTGYEVLVRLFGGDLVRVQDYESGAVLGLKDGPSATSAVVFEKQGANFNLSFLRVRAVNAGGAGEDDYVSVPMTRARVSVAAGDGVAEGSPAEFTVTADRPVLHAELPLEVSVSVSETGGDMVAAADEGTRTVAFAVGATSAALAVATADDGEAEDDSTVTAAIAADAGYRVGTPASDSVTVTDAGGAGLPGAVQSLRATEGHCVDSPRLGPAHRRRRRGGDGVRGASGTTDTSGAAPVAMMRPPPHSDSLCPASQPDRRYTRARRQRERGGAVVGGRARECAPREGDPRGRRRGRRGGRGGVRRAHRLRPVLQAVFRSRSPSRSRRRAATGWRRATKGRRRSPSAWARPPRCSGFRARATRR